MASERVRCVWGGGVWTHQDHDPDGVVAEDRQRHAQQPRAHQLVGLHVGFGLGLVDWVGGRSMLAGLVVCVVLYVPPLACRVWWRSEEESVRLLPPPPLTCVSSGKAFVRARLVPTQSAALCHGDSDSDDDENQSNLKSIEAL